MSKMSEIEIQPKDIDTTKFFCGAFGHEQTAESARWIVKYCQQIGKWVPFTHMEIEHFCSSRYGRKRFNFYWLVHKGFSIKPTSEGEEKIFHRGDWLIKNQDKYIVTQDFIEQCYKISPKSVLG